MVLAGVKMLTMTLKTLRKRSKCTKLTTFNTFFLMFFLEIFLKNIPYKYSGQLFLTIIPYIYYNYNNIIMNSIIRIKINLLEPAHGHAGIHYYNIRWRPLLVFLCNVPASAMFHNDKI